MVALAITAKALLSIKTNTFLTLKQYLYIYLNFLQDHEWDEELYHSVCVSCFNVVFCATMN